MAERDEGVRRASAQESVAPCSTLRSDPDSQGRRPHNRLNGIPGTYLVPIRSWRSGSFLDRVEDAAGPSDAATHVAACARGTDTFGRGGMPTRRIAPASSRRSHHEIVRW